MKEIFSVQPIGNRPNVKYRLMRTVTPDVGEPYTIPVRKCKATQGYSKIKAEMVLSAYATPVEDTSRIFGVTLADGINGRILERVPEYDNLCSDKEFKYAYVEWLELNSSDEDSGEPVTYLTAYYLKEDSDNLNPGTTYEAYYVDSEITDSSTEIYEEYPTQITIRDISNRECVKLSVRYSETDLGSWLVIRCPKLDATFIDEQSGALVNLIAWQEDPNDLPMMVCYSTEDLSEMYNSNTIQNITVTYFGDKVDELESIKHANSVKHVPFSNPSFLMLSPSESESAVTVYKRDKSLDSIVGTSARPYAFVEKMENGVPVSVITINTESNPSMLMDTYYSKFTWNDSEYVKAGDDFYAAGGYLACFNTVFVQLSSGESKGLVTQGEYVKRNDQYFVKFSCLGSSGNPEDYYLPAIFSAYLRLLFIFPNVGDIIYDKNFNPIQGSSVLEWNFIFPQYA